MQRVLELTRLEMWALRARYRLGAWLCRRVGHELRFHLPQLWPTPPWWDFFYAYCPRCGQMLPTDGAAGWPRL